MQNKYWILVCLLGLCWGSSFIFFEILLEDLPPVLVVYLRIVIAALIMLPFVIRQLIHLTNFKKNIFNLGIMGLLNNVLPFTLIAIGQQTTTAGLASILNANTAFLTIIIASFFIPNEDLKLRRLIGVIIGILGVIIAVDISDIFSDKIDGYGEFYILIATISYAFAAIWGKIKLNNLLPFVSAAGMLMASTILMTPLIIIKYYEILFDIKLFTFFIAVIFSTFCTVFAYVLYFKILDGAGAGNLLLSTILIPPIAIILEILFLNNRIELFELIGMMITIAGLLFLDGRIVQLIRFYFLKK
ncbi:MAG: ABC transporter permease [Rhodobacterales bacterium]|nr:ABC transporter permease [Rhodobacterales bacterium]